MANAPKDKSSDKARVVNLADFKAKKNEDEGFTAPTSLAHPALRALKKKGDK
jgi:hypothetical protein